MRSRNNANKTKQGSSQNGLLTGLRRGGPGTPMGAQERFPTAEEIASDPALAFDMTNKAGKIITGLVGGEIHESVDRRTGNVERFASGGSLIGFGDDRHCALVAPARSGKSRSHFLPILCTYPADASIVVVDVKGDLASHAAAYRASLGQRLWLMDPFHAASCDVDQYRRGSGFNPLAGIHPEDSEAVVERAILVASSLVTRSQGEEAHWNDTAEQAIAGVCAHVMTSPLHAEHRHLGTVFRLLTEHTETPDADTPSDLEAEMRTNPAAEGMVVASGAALFEKSDRELSSVLSTARRHLAWLQYPQMRRVIEGGSVDLGSMQTIPTTLFVSMPVRHLSSCAGFIRMVLNCLFASFESGESRRAHQVQQGGHRTLIILDELPALGYMRSIEIAAGQIAGLGAKLYVCAQDLNQLKAVYPKSWQTFFANSGLTTFIAPQDPTTLEWIQRRLGETVIVQHSQSEGSISSLIQDGNSGRSASLHMHPLLTASEAARILRREDPLTRQLVISASHGPMLLQRVMYDAHPAFAGRLNAVGDR